MSNRQIGIGTRYPLLLTTVLERIVFLFLLTDFNSFLGAYLIGIVRLVILMSTKEKSGKLIEKKFVKNSVKVDQ